MRPRPGLMGGVGGQLTDGGVGPGQKPPPEFFPSSEGP